MANFQEHINQAKSNAEVLMHLNATLNKSWDWQVTTCFYVAVHLINAHLAHMQNLHYRSHDRVKNAINPLKSIRIGTEIPEPIYISYIKLENLSRRSRYLCNDTSDSEEHRAYATYDKHFKKALVNLENLIQHIESIYGINFPVYYVNCPDILNNKLNYFRCVSTQ